jgi:hypothetical protein
MSLPFNEGMPQLTPDLIEEFVTWLTKYGIDLYSFQQSDLKYRRKLFKRFTKETNGIHNQIKIDFPD